MSRRLPVMPLPSTEDDQRTPGNPESTADSDRTSGVRGLVIRVGPTEWARFEGCRQLTVLDRLVQRAMPLQGAYFRAGDLSADAGQNNAALTRFVAESVGLGAAQ
jgi:hypothetical protein